jgi:hypothetical protein
MSRFLIEGEVIELINVACSPATFPVLRQIIAVGEETLQNITHILNCLLVYTNSMVPSSRADVVEKKASNKSKLRVFWYYFTNIALGDVAQCLAHVNK